MTFWLVAAAATALCVALLLRPLLRRPRADAPRVDYDLKVYRDQLDEVERDLARGVLGADQAEAARIEIERRMLASAASDSGADSTAAPGAGRPQRPSLWLAATTTALIPVAAVALYLWPGAPGVPSLPFAERPTAGGEREDLISQMQARLQGEPEDPDGWRMLAGLYAHQERYDEAIDAYRRVLALTPQDRNAMGSLAEMLIARAGGEVIRDARLLLAEIIKANPGDPRARYYAGLAMSQDGMLRQAMEVWQGLLRDAAPDAPWRPVVQAQVDALSAEMGLAPPAATQPPTVTAPPGPSQSDVEAASQMSDEDRAAFIRSMVERLASRLEDEPGDLDGWLRLARAYQVLGETAEARAALLRAETAAQALPEDAPQRKAVQDALRALPAGD